MPERELIDAIQKDKASMAEKIKELIKINRQAGRGEAANAGFLSLAELNVWHGKSTERLYQHYPEFAADVSLRGPGGR